MPAPITPISGVSIPTGVGPAAQPESGSQFREIFSSAIENVERFRRDASTSVEKLLSGEGEELHTTVMASQRAELAFEMFLQVRNKVVNAYQEIMRMPM